MLALIGLLAGELHAEGRTAGRTFDVGHSICRDEAAAKTFAELVSELRGLGADADPTVRQRLADEMAKLVMSNEDPDERSLAELLDAARSMSAPVRADLARHVRGWVDAGRFGVNPNQASFGNALAIHSLQASLLDGLDAPLTADDRARSMAKLVEQARAATQSDLKSTPTWGLLSGYYAMMRSPDPGVSAVRRWLAATIVDRVVGADEPDFAIIHRLQAYRTEIKKDLEPDAIARLADRVRGWLDGGRFGVNPDQANTAAAFTHVRECVSLLARLGAPVSDDQEALLLAQAFEQVRAAKRSDLQQTPAASLLAVYNIMAKSADPRVVTARLQLVRQAVDRTLNSDEPEADVLGRLVAGGVSLRKDLDPDTLGRLAKRLRNWLDEGRYGVDPSRANAASAYRRVTDFRVVLERFGVPLADSECARAMAIAMGQVYAAKESDIASTPAPTLLAIHGILAKSEAPEVAQVRLKLANRIATDWIAAEMPGDRTALWLTAMRKDLEPAVRTKVVERVRGWLASGKYVTASPSMAAAAGTLQGMAKLLDNYGSPVNTDELDRAMVAVIAEAPYGASGLAQSDGEASSLYRTARDGLKVLSAENSEYKTLPRMKALQARLDSGAFSARAAQVLSMWHVQNPPGLAAWRTYVAQRAGDTAKSADDRADWCMIAAYLEEIEKVRSPDPEKGLGWLNKALDLKLSEAKRESVVDAIAARHAAAGHTDRAREVITEYVAAGDRETRRVAAQAWLAALERIDRRREAQREQQLTESENAHLRELRARLGSAQEKGDEQEAARYQGLIDQALRAKSNP